MNVKLHRSSYISSIAAALLTAFALILTGCSLDMSPTSASVDSPAAIAGIVHGGPNPVQGAAVTLYGTTTEASPSSGNGYGYGEAGTVLGTATTASDGSFTITLNGNSCTGQQEYIAAAGGFTGINSANTAALLMAAIGPCSSLSTSVWIDEPSTIAAAYALSGFMTVSGTTVNISAPTNNNATAGSCTGTGTSLTCSSAGLAHAFLNAANLVSASNTNGVTSSAPTGLAYVTLPTNAKGTVPQSTIHALANSVEACINSSGSGSTPCTNLMSYTEPPTALLSSSVTPSLATNTLQALLDLAQFPQPTQASAIFGLGSSIGYYSPALATTPTDWTLAINYKGSNATNFIAPWFVTTDIKDNVYVSDDVSSTNMSIFSVSSNGTPNWITHVNGTNPVIASSSGDGMALVTDAVNGYVYAPNAGFLYQLNSSSGTVNQTIAAPSGGNLFAGAVDKNGNLFVTGYTANPGLQELPVSGSTLTSVNVNSAEVTAQLRYLSFDASGNLWAGSKFNVYYAANSGSVAAPAYTTAAVITPAIAGSGSEGVEGIQMIDTLGNDWVATDQNIYKIVGGQTAVPAGSGAATLEYANIDGGTDRYAAMDGNNNIYFASASMGAGYLSIFYTAGPTATSANVWMNPCNVGALTSCGTTSYALVNVVRGVAIDSTGSIWAAVVASDDVVQVLGPGAPTWSQANYKTTGLPQ